MRAGFPADVLVRDERRAVSCAMDSPWRLVPASEARPAGAPPEARARGWLRRLVDRLAGDDAPPDPTPSQERLGPIDEARLARLVPDPPESAQRAAVDAARGQARRVLILRPDDGGWDAVLDDAGPGGREVVPPADEALLGSALPSRLAERLADPEPLHLARLERWGVRHHDGLAALRTLLTLLASREGPWSADVGPWAWAWMRSVLPEAQGLPAPLAPAPLDGAALSAWLDTGAPLRIRGRGDAPDDATFRALAVRSQGSAGTAAAIWRACLRDGAERPTDGDGDEENEGRDGGDAGGGGGEGGGSDEARQEHAVWLVDPARIELPSAAWPSRDELLVLHAVLLLGGALPCVVARSVPGLSTDPEGAIRRAARYGLLRMHGGRVRAAPLALPSLRDRLTSEAFMVDAP